MKRAFAGLIVACALGVWASPGLAQGPDSSEIAPSAPATRVVTLSEALRIAAQQQPQIKQARASTAAAYGRVDESRAGVLPQVVGTATYQRTTANFAPRPGFNTSLSTTPAPSWTKTYNYFTFSLQATQLIYDFGQTTDRWRSSEALGEVAKAQERVTFTQVQHSVRAAYWSARTAKALLQVANETLVNQQRHLSQIEGYVSNGLRPEIDLAQARTDVANARVSIINAQNQLDIARSQLSQAMGLGVEEEVDVAEEFSEVIDGEDGPVDALIRRALANRPELVALERQQRAQELTVRAIKGAYGPQLLATGSLTANGLALDALGPNWAVGAQLNWPIFEGGLTKAQVREAEANVSVTQAQADAAKLQVAFDVRQAWVSVRGAKATIYASREALSSAREQLRLAEGRYENGVGSVIELGDAQLAASSAAAQLAQAEMGLGGARAQLLASIGSERATESR